MGERDDPRGVHVSHQTGNVGKRHPQQDESESIFSRLTEKRQMILDLSKNFLISSGSITHRLQVLTVAPKTQFDRHRNAVHSLTSIVLYLTLLKRSAQSLGKLVSLEKSDS